MRRAIAALLWTTAVVTFGLGALAALMFYQFYLKWYGLFENGRYFDPTDSVVHTDTAFVLGPITALFWAACVAAILLVRRLRSTQRVGKKL
jgi:hypothetical protein